MSVYLVTGGAGFIGSHIVEECIGRGHKVRVLDNLSTGFLANLAPFKGKVNFIKGDIRNPAALKRAMRGVKGVFHAAALRAVAQSVEDPRLTHEMNITGTLNVLMAAKTARVKRVVFSSSSSVYGDADRFPLTETDLPMPASPYAASKLAGEHYCRLYHELYGVETVSLRYFNVFGPRQNPESKYSCVIPILAYFILKGKSPEIHWDGKQMRDFIHVKNVSRANWLAMSKSAAAGKVFNVGSQKEYSVLDVFAAIKKTLNKPSIKPVFAPKRAGDVRRTYADIRLAKKILSYKVSPEFYEGLDDTVRWFVSSGVLQRIKL